MLLHVLVSFPGSSLGMRPALLMEAILSLVPRPSIAATSTALAVIEGLGTRVRLYCFLSLT